MKSTLYRVFKIATVTRITSKGLTIATSNGLVNLQQVAQYQTLKQVKNYLNVDKLNKQTQGLKLTKPIVHNDSKYLVVKLGA